MINITVVDVHFFVRSCVLLPTVTHIVNSMKWIGGHVINCPPNYTIGYISPISTKVIVQKTAGLGM